MSRHVVSYGTGKNKNKNDLRVWSDVNHQVRLLKVYLLQSRIVKAAIQFAGFDISAFGYCVVQSAV